MTSTKLPIGEADFKEVITGSYYYVDKTHFIKEIIDSGDKIMIIPRPRRFGKTLNMSMLGYFYTCSPIDRLTDKPFALPPQAAPLRFNYSRLFSNLAIQKAGSKYLEKMAQFPVIFLSFKDIRDPNWDSCLDSIKSLIKTLYLLHDYLLESPALKPAEKSYYQSIIDLKGSTSDYAQSLKFLLYFLTSHYDRKAVILIDEYDAPVLFAYNHQFYEPMVDFMRQFLGGGLKDTGQYLEKAVVTGILRITKESIFSGLNNPSVHTLLSKRFNSSFGFTEPEVQTMLADFQMIENLEEVQRWYNGYCFGGTVIYNPWSIINYLSEGEKTCKPYWVNTSDNAIVEKNLSNEGKELKEELETLFQGKSIEKCIDPNIILPDVEIREDFLWAYLLMTGYLKQTAERQDNNTGNIYYTLSVPNSEVRYYFGSVINRYFSNKIGDKKLQLMLAALIEGDVEKFAKCFGELVTAVLSFHDLSKEPERVYHAFTAGLLVWLGNAYEITSNRESGYGRYDILIMPKDTNKIGYVIEFKKVDKKDKETIKSALASALDQIQEKQYAQTLKDRGISRIIEMAIAFSGKKTYIRIK